MLTYLCIENFILIEKCELEFKPGLTIITGETGAGKSMILDAIMLSLGGRAEGHFTRKNSQKCDITAIFDITQNTAIQAWLAEKNIETTNECFLRRTLSQEGRSRSFINGQPVPVQILRELGALLVNYHGQHEHQTLLNRDTHRQYLDAYGQHETLVSAVKQHYDHHRDIENQLKIHHARFGNRDTRLEFLDFQLKELSALNLTRASLQSLEAEYKSLSMLKEHRQTYDTLLTLLEETLLPSLSKAKHLSQPLPALLPLLDNAHIQIEEATHDIKDLTKNCDINSEHLTEMEQQLTAIYDVARKHRIKPEALPDLSIHLAEELKLLQGMENTITSLEKSLKEISLTYKEAAKKLSEHRYIASKAIAKEIEEFMHMLGMKGAKFFVALTPHEENHLSPYGLEKVEFLVAANPGQPFLPLSKTASGGELSRISLAIDLIAARHQALPTLIFDEVDVGIGGNTAAKVGQLLRQLSEKAQVICITHHPQVAALGNQHLQVEKTISKNETITNIHYLNTEEKIQEIARMLGGIEITPQTLSHAKELVEN